MLRATAQFGLWLFIACYSLHSSGHCAIIIDGYTAATNDRFSNNSAFIGSAFNFSGVGQTGAGLWATAISNNVILSAAHFAPSGNVFFYSDNNPASTPVIRSIQFGQKIPGTDLYIARLQDALPTSIQFYSYATEFLTTNAGIYQNMVAFMVGRSPTSHPDNQSQAVGQNRISAYSENEPFLGNTDADMIYLNRDPSSSVDWVPYEAYLQGGDSGGPLFVAMGGQLRLLGTNAGITTEAPFLSAINYTGNQASFINNFVNINAVPEPSSVLLVGLGVAMAVSWRSRKSFKMLQ